MHDISARPAQAGSRNGGQILVSALARNGVDTIYCVPGESYLPVLDALHDDHGIRTIVTRHEGAASNMADAYGKLTGRPGICFVTRGPGATHAANGVHTAHQDSTPMILFVGQVETGFLEREAFQEIDYRQMFGGMAKWVTQIESIDRIPEIVSRAFATALSGRQGPVVIALPEDVLFNEAMVTDAAPPVVAQSAPVPADMARLEDALAKAERPLVIVGGTGWNAEGLAAFRSFVQAYDLPVAASFRRQDILDNRLPQYVGQVGIGLSPKLAARVREADVLVVVGSRLSESVTEGYTLINIPVPASTMVHVHPDPNELGHVYRADLPISASLNAFSCAAAALKPAHAPRWGEWRATLRQEFEAFRAPPAISSDHKGVDLTRVVLWLDQHLPENATIANGAGNYTAWVHRFYQYRQYGTELAPTNGAMGYGLPAAIAAKLHAPQRVSVCFAGDGCFMMYPQELATAMQYDAPVITIVVNNGKLATIRMHQEKHYPGRVSATELKNPDFTAMAKAFGAYAERIENTDDFPHAFERALKSGRPALLELITDPDQITAQMRLSDLRRKS